MFSATFSYFGGDGEEGYYMGTITLLHVSDVHFGVHEPGDQRRITDGVLDAIRDHLSEGRSPPVFCIFSGDLTQSATSDQFDEAEQWLQRLSETASPSGAPLFIVPGNHDVRRPERGSDEEATIVRDWRSAHHSKTDYGKWVEKVKAVPLLRPFFDWHERAKMKIPIHSSWTVDAPFACCYTTTFSGIKVHLVGLNTATLSCDNDDQNHLVGDETALNNKLAGTSFRTELIILVTHHPIKVGEHLEQWLAEWNDKRLSLLLLQQTGPHLYLHGHLHEGIGIGTSQSTGQNLTSFGAGAIYQHDKYPMKFAFYDIRLSEGEVKPWMYVYEKGSGRWIERGAESQVMRTVLPVPRDAGVEELRKHTDALQTSLYLLSKEHQRLRNAYRASHETLTRVVEELYPAKEGLRHHLESMYSRAVILSNGDAEINETYVIYPCSKLPIHFWKTTTWVDPESAEMPFIGDIKLAIEDLSGKTDVTYLPLLDEGRKKILCVFFLPEISPNQKRAIKVTYSWPGYVPHLVTGDRVLFEWGHNTGLPDKPLKIELILDIDEAIGPIEYESRTPRTRWKMRKTKTGTRLRYQCNEGTLTSAHKVVVWRTEPTSAAPATPAARHE